MSSRARDEYIQENPDAQGVGAAVAGTMGGIGQGMGMVSQGGDARLQAAAMPGGMGNPRWGCTAVHVEMFRDPSLCSYHLLSLARMGKRAKVSLLTRHRYFGVSR
jgi:hypothetical protein